MKNLFMKKLLFAATFLLCFCASATRADDNAPRNVPVSVTDGTITMETYEHSGRELQPPLFADSALVGIYPFPTYKMPLKATPTPIEYKAIFVENEYLKLTYVPEFGGRFLSLYDKLRKTHVFYKNDVIKPTQFNARGDWPQEGIELTGPFDVHSLTIHSDPYWSNTVIKHSDGSVTLMLSEIDPIYGMNVSLSATLYPGVAALQMSVFCFNPNTSRMPQMFWTNASFPATPDTRFLYPMTRTVGHNTGQVTDWPIYEGVDYSWDRNNKNMLGVFGIDLYDNFGGSYQFDRDYGVFRFADRRVVQGMKMWTFGHGRDAAAMEEAYTDKAGPYFEAQSGRHVWDGHYEWVAPHQVERWSEWWIPVAGTHGLSTLNPDVALNLRVDATPPPQSGSTLKVDLSPVRSFKHATLTVHSGQTVLLNQQLDLIPGTPIHKEIAASTKLEDLRDISVVVTAADGATLLDYRRPNPNETRSEYTPFTKELEKPAKSTDAMSAEELLLAAEFRLKELDTKGAFDLLALSLQKDPGYSSAHELKGIVLYKEGKLREAEDELQKAVDRNPYADKSWYYLAMAEMESGKEKLAERNLYYIWPESAFYGNREYQLGRLALLRLDYRDAISHLEGAVNSNGQDLSAHLLLAISYRSSGHTAPASGEIDRLLQVDPSNRGAYAERFFLTRDSAAQTELKRLMGDQTQEALHVSALYSSLGRWKEAADILQMEKEHNSDPFGTSAVFYYTLAYDQKRTGNLSAASQNLAKARTTAAVVDRFPYLPSSEAPLAAAVASNPNDTLARFDLGCLLYYLGRTDEAIAQWEAAAVVSSSDFKVERALGLAYRERGDTDRAIATLQKATAIDGSHLDTVNDLATLYAAAGRFEDELTLLHHTLKVSPGNDDIMLRLLQFNLVQGHYLDADEIIRTHTFSPRHRDNQLRDEYRSLKYAEGSQAFVNGQYQRALDLFHSIETPPSSLGVDDFQFESTPRLHYYLGRTLEALGRKAEAKQAYERSVKEVDLTAGDRASFNSDTFFMLLSLDRLGRSPEASDLAKKFEAFAQSQLTLSRGHRRAEGKYLLALSALRQGEIDKARLLMEESLKIEPDFLAPRFDLRKDSIGTEVAPKN
jgi:tetratricopeptide (TPR) repeat protein